MCTEKVHHSLPIGGNCIIDVLGKYIHLFGHVKEIRLLDGMMCNEFVLLYDRTVAVEITC